MREDEIRVSVIMGIYNQQNKEQLQAAVRSVLMQTFRQFEFIIYNDGSDEAVSDELRMLSGMDERIRFIDNPVNHGLAYSLNSCIDVARGEYIARMDGDDICMPERLRVQYEYLERHPETAFVGCNAGLLDDSGTWGVRRMPEHPAAKDFLRYSPFIHPTVMIRKRVLQDAQGYRATKETLRCEDYELFMRLWRLGYTGCNLQQELFLYREDRASYQKRKMCYRMDEMKLRYRNFKELHLLFPLGWAYVLRPLAAALVPDEMIYGVKKLYGRLMQRRTAGGAQRRETLYPGGEGMLMQPGQREWGKDAVPAVGFSPVWERIEPQWESHERSSYGKA